ncbi:MAG: protein-disulfide reductase DsbD family protein, partial [Hydrogenophaga sp.]|nr:protein-disulfide reductase DsbD family protein [Hydrogenophaga sp.]
MFPTLFNTAIPNTLQRRSGVALRRWLPAMLLALLIALLAPHTAQSQGLLSATAGTTVVQTEQVRAELLAHAPQGAAPGQTVWVGLQLSHQPHWHTYWKNSGDSGLPTQLNWQLPPGTTAGEIAWPTPKKFPLGPLANYGYDGTVLLAVPLTVESTATGPTITLVLEASWLVCRKECIPQDGRFSLTL